MIPVTPEDWAAWKSNSVTKLFLSEVLSLREEGLEELAAGVHTMDINRTHLLIGKLNAFTAILQMDFVEKD